MKKIVSKSKPAIVVTIEIEESEKRWTIKHCLSENMIPYIDQILLTQQTKLCRAWLKDRNTAALSVD